MTSLTCSGVIKGAIDKISPAIPAAWGHADEVPLKVSISEAIEIAKVFSTNDSGRFVNGILDAIYHDIVSGKMVAK